MFLKREGRKATVSDGRPRFSGAGSARERTKLIAARSEVREQLREWVDDFEAEAEATEGRRAYRE